MVKQEIRLTIDDSEAPALLELLQALQEQDQFPSLTILDQVAAELDLEYLLECPENELPEGPVGETIKAHRHQIACAEADLRDMAGALGSATTQTNQLEGCRLLWLDVVDGTTAEYARPLGFSVTFQNLFREALMEVFMGALNVVPEYRNDPEKGIELTYTQEQISPRAVRWLIKHYGLDGEQQYSFKDIGEEFGISAGRVREMVRKAFLVILMHPEVKALIPQSKLY